MCGVIAWGSPKHPIEGRKSSTAMNKMFGRWSAKVWTEKNAGVTIAKIIEIK
ncbi:hypothetical protein RSSM_06641 [Rhodopirellula sallentina SM41]|uniref:Uncharacterized protein n=1 Tax=Rhodopirellula sallentina SM41 TaxID=1263870 RepID=M5TS82_9BACT|nr:hypothetical protein RSSM_06641 [Rhodopirellula sallentina SM41]